MELSGTDSIQVAAGIAPGQVTLLRIGNDLVVRVNGSGEELRVLDQFGGVAGRAIESITFVDSPATIWGATEINAATSIITGTAAPELLTGSPGSDVLNGLGGNDGLQGNAGNDTYVLALGGGQDQVMELSGTDTIQVAAGIAPGQVSLLRVGNDLVVRINGTSEELRVIGQFSGNAGLAIESITLVDSPATVWDAAFIGTAAPVVPVATEGPDVLNGSSNADTISGLGGNDTISGGGGNDTLNGNAGNDSIYGGDGDDILMGGAGDDNLRGDEGTAGNDTLDGGPGNDMLAGLWGSDKYHFGFGSGHDFLNEIVAGGTLGDVDVLEINANPDQVKVTRLASAGGDGVRLTLTGGQDSFTVTRQFSTDGTGLEEVRFADGTVWSRADIATQVREIFGTGSNDILNGSSGDDTLAGGFGIDQLYGGAGSDTYLYESIIDGHDLIFEVESDTDTDTDVLVMGGGITPAGVTLQQYYTGQTNDLIVFRTNEQKVTVRDHFGGSGKGIEAIRFTHGTADTSDDTVWTLDQINRLNGANALPVGTVSISGQMALGQTLTASNNLTDADGIASPVTYQWLQNGVPIANATGDTFVVTAGQISKVIRVIATYTDGLGQVHHAQSAVPVPVPSVQVDGNWIPEGQLRIIGTPNEGETLLAVHDLHDDDGPNPLVISFQWFADGAAIEGATTNLLIPGQAEVGKALTVQASYVDGQGKTEAVTSAATATITNFNNPVTGSVNLQGEPVVGAMLSAIIEIQDPDGIGDYQYQWLRDDAEIPGATTATYVVQSGDIGTAMTLVVSYVDDQGAPETIASAPTSPVVVFDPNANQAPTGDLTISGIAAIGETLTLVETINDANGIVQETRVFQWYANGDPIPSATGTSYVVSEIDDGKVISVSLRYTDNLGNVEFVQSSPTSPIGALGPHIDFSSGHAITNLSLSNTYSDDHVYDMAIQSDGKVVVVGGVAGWDIALLRHNIDGTLDSGFGTGGMVTIDLADDNYGTSVALDSSGRILVAGYSSNADSNHFVLIRLEGDGSIDSSFGSNGMVVTDAGGADNFGAKVLISGEKIILGGFNQRVVLGEDETQHIYADVAIARYNSDGTLDTTFGTNGIAGYPVTSFWHQEHQFALQPDGSILVGMTLNQPGESTFGVLRFNADGSIDSTFGNNGMASWNGNLPTGDWTTKGIAVQTNGSILLSGEIFGGEVGQGFFVARYLPNGQPDASFGTDGIATLATPGRLHDLTVDSDGNILLSAGLFNENDGIDFAVIRLLADGTPAPAFGADGIMVSNAPGVEFHEAVAIGVRDSGEIVVAGDAHAGGEADDWDFSLTRLGQDGSLLVGIDVNGTSGNDTLVGTLGGDSFNGGDGNDIFWLSGSINISSTDVITDFSLTDDKLGLTGGLTYGDLVVQQGNGTDTASSNTLVLNASSNEYLAILLETQSNLLTASHFQI